MDKWTTGEAPKVCEKCDWAGEDGFNIAIHPDVLGVAFYLCREVKTEWQMFLSGSVDGKKVYVTGYYIPKQEVSHTTVKNLEAVDKKYIEDRDIVATMHSHADMGVFFSQVDDEYTNMSWIKHHVVINNKHDFVAKSRHDLPCGGVKFVNSVVETMIGSVQEAEGLGNITKYEYKSAYPAASGFSTGGGLYDRGDYNRDWQPEEGYWENGVWKPANKAKPFNDLWGNRFQKVNGVWKYNEVTGY